MEINQHHSEDDIDLFVLFFQRLTGLFADSGVIEINFFEGVVVHDGFDADDDLLVYVLTIGQS